MSSITYNDARAAVYTRFLNNFTGTSNITFPNENYDKPDNDSWVRVSVITLSRKQNTLGRSTNRVFRTKCLIYIQVFTPIDIGLKTGDTLATEALNIFEATSFSGVDCGNGTITEEGLDGKWYNHLVSINMDYDEIK